MASTLRERLYTRLVPDPDSGCLLWTGATTSGYGRIRGADGRMQVVHRVVWELEVGPIPDGLTLDHVKARGCVHRNCANVAHLEPVTIRENVLRGDTPAAANAAKAHCPQNHLYDQANTRIGARGERFCRACHRDSERARRAGRRAA